jgi:septal ring factor EnvC (AmiA/AmiB activator)
MPKVKRYYWDADRALFPMPDSDTEGLCKSKDVDALETEIYQANERLATQTQHNTVLLDQLQQAREEIGRLKEERSAILTGKVDADIALREAEQQLAQSQKEVQDANGECAALQLRLDEAMSDLQIAFYKHSDMGEEDWKRITTKLAAFLAAQRKDG